MHFRQQDQQMIRTPDDIHAISTRHGDRQCWQAALPPRFKLP